MSKTKNLRAAFVVTTAIVATVGAAGCFNSTTNPPEPFCPASQPEDGGDCPDVGALCDYGDDSPCADEPAHRASCGGDNKWKVEFTGSTCNPPPPPQCPETLPLAGELCEVDQDGNTAMGCSYTVTTSCGEQKVDPVCVKEQDQAPLWKVEIPACEGDPVGCGDYDHPDVCGADSVCRWLAPACSEGAAFDAGCFAKQDCEDECGDGLSCEKVVYGATCEDAAQVCLAVPMTADP